MFRYNIIGGAKMQSIRNEVENIQILTEELRSLLKKREIYYDNYFEEIMVSLSFISGYTERALVPKDDKC